MSEFEIISWERFHKDCEYLAAMLKDTASDFKKVITIARGGLIPSGIITSILNIRLIDVICMESYSEDHKQGNLIVRKESNFVGDGSDILVIDDIVDTGNTIANVRKLYPKAFVAAPYVKKDGRAMADIFVDEINRWIILPWEPRPSAN
ncbi:MAG: xanthine phosphoribosyltransferase [Rickettsiales bacterium]|jgi:xanthine phosphoribosyltransferase|nr:xanthine phosphoribosyltransferase [Rickettsiales bacterium]